MALGFSGASLRSALLEGLALAALTRMRSHNNMVRSSHEVGRSVGDMAPFIALLQPFGRDDPADFLSLLPLKIKAITGHSSDVLIRTVTFFVISSGSKRQRKGIFFPVA
jgi:hypothetical protein